MGAICCCTPKQTEGLVCFAVTLVFTLIFWHNRCFSPLKLIAVFLHELGHATGAIISCGKVKDIDVNENFGGVTTTQGGKQIVILPLGYIGSMIFGGLFIISCATKLTTQIGAVCFILAAIATAIFLAGKVAFQRIFVCIVASIVALVWFMEEAVDWFHDNDLHPLAWTLFILGTVCVLHAVYDTYDDVVRRKVEGSDASRFAQEFCGEARCWGVVWTIISLFMGCMSYYLFLYLSQDC